MLPVNRRSRDKPGKGLFDVLWLRTCEVEGESAMQEYGRERVSVLL
jgi:hypothetical protein